MRRLARPLAFLVLASAPAFAGVITVDDGGGADFTDLPAAVAAASSGDTLLVHPGTYSAFLLDGKPLTILGLAAGQVAVLGTTRVRALGAGPATVLCQLDFERLTLADNTGTVVLDDVRASGEGSAFLRVANCHDVRATASQFESAHAAAPHVGNTQCAVLVEGGSRFELGESLAAGNSTTAPENSGWQALDLRGASRAYLAASSLRGGTGGYEPSCLFVCCDGYDGGRAAFVLEASRLRATGQTADVFGGGLQGPPYCGGPPAQQCAVWASGASSSAALFGVTLENPGLCSGFGGTAVYSPTGEPWLERDPAPQSGGVVTLHVRGEPGDLVTLYLGRSAVVVPIPGVEIEQLTSEERAFDLGVVGAAGVVSFALPTPISWPSGFTFFGQARVLRNGVELRTNSAPIVLR
jgi:hypothetical protein